MVDRLFRWIVDFLLCGRVLKELYKFFTVYACIYLPRCSMYKKTGREEKKIGKLFFLFSFFFQKKKNNSYLISYVTDSFEFFKRYEKFLGWNLGWNWKNGWKKKKKKRERDKVFLLLSPLYEFRQNCWSDIGNLAVVIECCAVWKFSLSWDELHLPRELTRLRSAATSVYGIPRMRALIVVVVSSISEMLIAWLSF